MALQAIRDRQQLVEEDSTYSPFHIFVEAGTTNGTSLIKFKKGAFASEKKVRPVFLKYKSTIISPAFDIIELIPLLAFQLSWCCLTCDVCVMPDFEPNEYLFQTHADKGASRWEIYAWAVRDAMMRAGDFKYYHTDQTLATKFKY